MMDLMKKFEEALLEAGYKEKTPSGHDSTVPEYLRSLEKVCENEGLSSIFDLGDRIDLIVPKYDIGGIEEEFGSKSKRTVINALKAFQQFVQTRKVIKKRK